MAGFSDVHEISGGEIRDCGEAVCKKQDCGEAVCEKKDCEEAVCEKQDCEVNACESRDVKCIRGKEMWIKRIRMKYVVDKKNKSGMSVESNRRYKKDFRIMAASDLHYLSPQLMEYRGKFRELCEALQETEMGRLEKFMEEWLNRVMEARPDVLLITGDLSYQGEKLSHIQLAEKFDRLLRVGIPVYVIPGNQDMDNPFSTCWRPSGDQDYTPAESVSPREFREIYSSVGYGCRAGEICIAGDEYRARGIDGDEDSEKVCGGHVMCADRETSAVISRAPDSFSYQVRLQKASGEILYLFMLDTTIPGSPAGRIAPGTFAWLEERLEKKGEELPCLIAGHHPMLSLNEETAPFVLENGQALVKLMKKYGAPLYISGHLHREGTVRYSETEGQKTGHKKILTNQVDPVNIYLEKRGLRLL